MTLENNFKCQYISYSWVFEVFSPCCKKEDLNAYFNNILLLNFTFNYHFCIDDHLNKIFVL